ncbi:hypothetical protein HHI36_022105 [Cryptolaemus montrouzieri]|uniref:Uncharacterized protein n=1 Tax=Cryptolaemus montrouzieri TaxID=559131 RepID=A0ABD2MZL7_9CUCU
MYEKPPSVLTHTVNTREVQPKCPENFSGRMPNYSNCSHFIVCMQGEAMNQVCPPGTLFDTNRNVCDFPKIAKCFNGQNVDSQRRNVDYFVVGGSNQIEEKVDPNFTGKYEPNIPGFYETQYNQNRIPQGSGQSRSKINCDDQIGCPKPFANHPPNRNDSGVPRGYSPTTPFNQGYKPVYTQNFQNNGNVICDLTTSNCQPASDVLNNQGFKPSYQSNTDLQSSGSEYIGVQSSNCFPPNCRQGSNSNNNNDQIPAASNVHIISQCNPQTPNCRGLPPNTNQNRNVRILACQGNNCRYIPNSNAQQPSNGQVNSNDCSVSGKCIPNQNYGGQYPNRGFNQNSNQGFGTTSIPNRVPTQSNRQNNQVECPSGATGVHPHPYDCSKFLNCANGQTFVQNCGPGTLFNPKMLVCDFDYNVDCNKKGFAEISDNFLPSTKDDNKSNQEYEIKTTTYTYLTPDSNNLYSSTPRGHYITKPPKSQVVHGSTDYNDIGSNIPGFPQNRPPSSNGNQGLGNKRESGLTQKENTWPPPFPATDTNADYVFDYYDVDMEPVPDPQSDRLNSEIDCTFKCNNFQKKCVSKRLVCDGKKDCQNGADEEGCNKHLDKFEVKKNTRLAVIEKERWDNTTVHSCAYLCLESKKFDCKSFNFRNIDNCCLLSDMNEGLSGRLMAYQPNDYYELKNSKLDCSNMFECSNNKCIDKNLICDGQNDCGDREDEKNCPAAKIGYKLSLANGKHPWEGRIEVYAFGRSGFICDDRFDIRDANVACKELGYPLGAAEIKGSSYFAQDVPRDKVFYMMDDVTCEGNETSLKDCDFNGWGSHDCTDQEVVGVICKAAHENCPESFWKCKTTNECVPMAFVCDGPEDCSDGSEEDDDFCSAPIEIRLVNGTKSSEGRLEVKFHSVWGTICDDDFNDDAAKVVCRNLGFKGTVTVKKEAYFGQGTGPIWLDQVSCFGNETKLEKCGHWNWGEHNCDHSEDVGVICSNFDTSDIERHVKTPQKLQKSEPSSDPAYPIYPASCGLRKDTILRPNSNVHFRVVKGSTAKVGDFPWQAAVRVRAKLREAHWCGAVVISAHFVLTAAHCLVGYPKGAYIIVAGDYNIQEDEGTEQHAFIEEYYIHEDFRKGHKMNNDIALIKLKGKGFMLNGDVMPICLPDADTNYDVSLNCTVSGFGSIESGTSAFSNELRAGTVPLQPEKICKMPHVYGPNITDGMICAGYLDGGTDSCDGDSGGPLACLDEGFFTLYGITSWGERCGYANKPGVYVKVAKYRKWIDDKIRKNI